MSGFSLIEMMLYVAITSLMFSGLFTSAAFLHDALRKNEQEAHDLLRSLNGRDARDLGTHAI